MSLHNPGWRERVDDFAKDQTQVEELSPAKWLEALQAASHILHNLSHDTFPKSPTPLEQPERAYIAFTQALFDAVEYWTMCSSSNTISVIPFDQREIINRLDYAVRQLRHTQ